MSTFYDPGPLPGWPVSKPRGRGADTPTGSSPVDGLDSVPDPNLDSVPGTVLGTDIDSDQGTLERISQTTGGREPDSGRRAPIRLPMIGTNPAEARVRALRDAVRRAAVELGSGERVVLQEVFEPLWAVSQELEGGDLGSDGVTIGQQFEAFFERFRGLVAEHREPVPTDSLGLPHDTRFLEDMAEFLSQNYALDTED